MPPVEYSAEAAFLSEFQQAYNARTLARQEVHCGNEAGRSIDRAPCTTTI
jgi:hypothetical protein